MTRTQWLVGLGAAALAASCGLAQVIVDDAGSARNGKVGYWSSMVARGGDAAISYYCEDDSNGSPPEMYTLRFAWATGTTWQHTTVDYGAGSDTSMGRGGNGLYRIAYESWNGLGFATGVDTTWNVSLVPTPANAAPAHISMVLDSADRPHIAYYDYANGSDHALRYTYWDGSQWRTSANEGLVALGAWTPTIGFSNTFLALDGAGTPHLAYAMPQDNINAWGPIQYATLVGNTWQMENLGVSGVDPTMAIGGDGVARMVFNGNGGITYAYKSGGVWHYETIVSAASGDSLSMALSATDQPYVSFGMGANEDMYLANRSSGGQWTATRIDGDGTSDPHVILGRYGTSVTVDSNAMPHVSYLDIDIYSTTHRCDLKYFGPGGGPVCVSFVRPPAPTGICVGGNGSFDVLVTGSGPFTYQWQWQLSGAQPWQDVADGTNYSPINGAPLFVANGAQATTVSMTDIGLGVGAAPLFRCAAAASCGSATSSAAALSVATIPSFTAQPQNTQACSSGSASFTAAASGNPTLRWQVFDSWSSSWDDLTDGVNTWAGYVCTVSGSGSAMVVLGAAPQTPGGTPELFPMTVRCVATTACASVNSDQASVSITGPCCGSADFNHDGDVGTDSDIEDFFACLAGDCCATCEDVDFNNDGDVGTDADIESFFRVLAGGAC
jgi:hypothetical protein